MYHVNWSVGQASVWFKIVSRLASWLAHRQKKLIVEADGFEYHSAEKDLKRDIAIKEKYGVETLRFGGSRIYRDAQIEDFKVGNFFSFEKK